MIIEASDHVTVAAVASLESAAVPERGDNSHTLNL